VDFGKALKALERNKLVTRDHWQDLFLLKKDNNFLMVNREEFLIFNALESHFTDRENFLHAYSFRADAKLLLAKDWKSVSIRELSGFTLI